MTRGSGFVRLPQEILDAITADLEPKDLSSVSRTCKYARAATVPGLYRNIRMFWKGNAQPDVYPAPDFRQLTFPRLDLLVRTLLENPMLAEMVQTLDFQSSGFYKDYYHGCLPQLPPSPISHGNLFKDVLRRTGSPIPKDLNDDIDRGGSLKGSYLHLMVALSVLATPKLSCLTLGLDMIRENRYLPYVLACALSVAPGSSLSDLSSLERVTLGADYDREHFPENPRRQKDLGNRLDLQSYLPFLYSPNLKEVEMNLPGSLAHYRDNYKDFWKYYTIKPGDPRTIWPLSWPPCAAAVRTLRLPRTLATAAVLEQVLLATPNLVSLEYDCICFDFAQLDARLLESALKTVKKTLLRLKIPFKAWSEEFMDNVFTHLYDWDIAGHCSLKDMSALTAVDVVPDVLMGLKPSKSPRLADVLPYNLKFLRLRGDCGQVPDYEFYYWHEEDVMSKITEFVQAERWREVTPQLQRIEIVWRMKSKHEDDPVELPWTKTKELEDLCTRNGLRCQVAEFDEEFDEEFDGSME